MLGRNTRAIEMSRGGREGNNAFLNYEASYNNEDLLQILVENGTEYKELMRLSKLNNSAISMSQLDTKMVTAVRRGHCELAHAIASAEAQYWTNELHRQTLK